MSRISNIETAILGLLYENSHHAYELDKIIKERGMRNWTEIGFSSIYYVLKRLEDNSLVEKRLEEVEGKPSRKVYTITNEGRIVMQEKVKELISKNEKLISPFDLGIANLDTLKPEEVVNCLKKYLNSTNKRIKFLEKSVEMHEKINSPYNVVALFSRPLMILKTEKRWVENFIEKVKEEENVEV